MNPRTCIVTRQTRDPEELIRFVADPAGVVVPDLRQRLPGRGVWVTARRSIVDQAVRKRLFSRGFKSAVTAGDDLAERVEALLEADALSALSMAMKAGLVRTGSFKVEGVLRSGEAMLLLHALDAAQDGVRKLAQAAHAGESAGGRPPVTASVFTSMQMDLALGGHNVVHAAAIDGGATRALIARIERLQRYRD